MADISKIKTIDGTTYNIKDANAIPKNTSGNTQMLRRPASLQGANDVTLDSKINTLRANRLAFLPADQIIIEKTTDGGTTWEDAGATGATKRGLFAETREYINIPLLNGKKSPLCGLRFTITGMKYNVPSGTSETSKYSYWNSSYIKSTERYCQLKEMYFWVSVSGGSINAKVERATGASPNNWAVIFNDTAFNMTGYSGNDYLSFPQGVFGGGTTQTGNYWNYRITLMTDDVIPAPPYDGYSQTIYEIRGYGDTWWSKPNEYMANDKLYTHDSLMNAQFPAHVTATQFNGPLNGNAATASLAVKSRALEGIDNRSTNQLPSWYISNHPYRMVKEFKTTSAIGVDSILTGWTYCELITDVYYADASGGYPIQIAISHTGKRAIRFATSTSAWGAWEDLSKPTGTSPISVSSSNVISIATASTSAYGATKLSTATNSTATDLAATPSSVKTAYDLANTANGTANTALSGVNGNLIYDHTFTISNGVATFVPHVYQKGSEVTTNYAKSCFTWKYRLIDGSEVALTTKSDRGCDVTITNLGYGGHVIGIFTPA